jgi:hypothetical protein
MNCEKSFYCGNYFLVGKTKKIPPLFTAEGFITTTRAVLRLEVD